MIDRILRTLALAVTLALPIGAMSACSTDRAEARPTATADTVRLEEDEPGFDCAVHGNKRCGTRPPLTPRAEACIMPKVYDPAQRRTVPVVVVTADDMPACLALAAREGHADTAPGANDNTPHGGFLVVECRVQYTGAELSACLRQS